MKSVNIGNIELTVISDGRFWLDGGAMFGVVPKVMWQKMNPADEQNRIELALNCLLIKTPDRVILVDTGVGSKLKDRFNEIYRIQRRPGLVQALHECGTDPEDIDTVINTHLHFDHCGGNTLKKDSSVVPTFGHARYIIQEQEWHDALHPNERTRASYLKDDFVPLKENGQLHLVKGDEEIVPGVRVIQTNGHTKGHQSVIIESQGEKAIYLGDLIPTASHINLPYIMSYDLYPLDLLETKKYILKRAADEHWLLIFEHDPRVIFAYIINENGKHIIKPINGSHAH
jgi:glyoxylase-like metal-dependent hydrolase (beta-lactamase superfamily II)